MNLSLDGPRRHGERAPAETPVRRLRRHLDDHGDPARALATAGCLDPDLMPGAARLLREVAAIDLSLGRLLEGHVNAMALVQLYGAPDLRRDTARAAARGVLFGVWGADDDPAARAEGDRLTGAKRFASGLGMVGRAIVSAAAADGQRLFVVDADDPARQDPSRWDMSGMQDSRSGRFECTGLRGQALGSAGIFTREPHFVGGTWRVAAVTLGAVVGLLDRAASVLRRRGHLDSDAHLLRLAPVAGRVVAAWPAIERAARIASGPEGRADPPRAATLSVSTRLLTEDLGQDAIAAVERSVGLSMFAATDPVGAATRDLACYLRQATRDAFCLGTGRAFLGQSGLGVWLDG